MRQATERHDRARVCLEAARRERRRFAVLLAALLAPHASCAVPAYGGGPVDEDAAGREKDGIVVTDASPCSGALCRDAGPVGSDGVKTDAASPAAATPGGSVSDAGVPDAQTPPRPPSSDGSFPPGSYVVHTRYYGIERSNSAVSYAEEVIMLGRVARDAQSGQLTLHVQFCDGRAVSGTGSITTTARIVAFERYPARVYTMQLTGDEFQTAGPDALAGFSARDAASCPAGTRVAAPLSQTWHSDGQCVCPSDDAPPSSADDCRVTDSDGDDHPGFTVRWTGAVARDTYAVRRDASRFIDGKVSPDGHHSATYLWKGDHVTLQCTSGSCSGSSSGLAFRPCATSVVNPVRFAPLNELAPSGSAWTCMEMLQQTPTLFPEQTLAIPDDC